MRVLVCGSRFWKNYGQVAEVLDDLYADLWVERDEPMVVIHGDARGADACAKQWCESGPAEQEPYPANWKVYGRAAGPIRNQQMLDEGKPDLVIAFAAKPLPESRGTADMVRRARKAKIPTVVERELV